MIPIARDTHPEGSTDPHPAGEPRSQTSALVKLVIVTGLVTMLLLGAGLISGWPGWLPSVRNPFVEQTTDRSQPVLLRSIQDLSRFTAASGNFEVVIDVETDRQFIPEILLQERTLFVAAGSVDAYVEFGGLAEGALVVDEAADTVEVNLPTPELTRPNIDHDRSYVFAEQRGVANRIRDLFRDDPDGQQQILQLAERRIAEAASVSGLHKRAEENTRRMLEGMLGALGFDAVTVTFGSP